MKGQTKARPSGLLASSITANQFVHHSNISTTGLIRYVNICVNVVLDRQQI